MHGDLRERRRQDVRGYTIAPCTQNIYPTYNSKPQNLRKEGWAKCPGRVRYKEKYGSEEHRCDGALVWAYDLFLFFFPKKNKSNLTSSDLFFKDSQILSQNFTCPPDFFDNSRSTRIATLFFFIT